MLQRYRENPRYFLSANWGNLSADQQQMFSSPSHDFCPSSYAPFQLARMMNRLEILEDRMRIEGENAFSDEVCGWFDDTLPREDVSMEPSLRDKVGEGIEAVYDSFTELSPMSEESLAELENKLKAAVQFLGDQGPKRRKGESRTLANVNHVAKHFDLPFWCAKKNKQLSRMDAASGRE